VRPENQPYGIQSHTEYEEEVVHSIGQLLREAREEKGLTIPQVAMETRIRQIYIRNIEEGNIDSLPGEIYKIGFIKTYAVFLDLDPTEILRRIGLPQEVSVTYANNKYAIIPTGYQRQSNKKILYLSILGAFGFSIFAYLIHNAGTERVDRIIVPQQEYKEMLEYEFAPKNIEALPQSESGAEGFIKTELSSMKGDNFKDIPPKESLIDNSLPIKSELQEKVSVKTPETSAPKPLNEIIIKAVKDSWIQILDSSEKTVYVRLMHPGDIYTVPQQQDHTLNTGNAGGVKIIFNGRETKLLGTNGQVIRGVNLTESGLDPLFQN
jgi:transcriptional regulator with XRE-family HTH domain